MFGRELALVLASTTSSSAYMYDVLSPELVAGGQCAAKGCAAWDSLPFSNSTQNGGPLWEAGNTPPAGAGQACAQPARATGGAWPGPGGTASTARPYGAWCFCADQDSQPPPPPAPTPPPGLPHVLPQPTADHPLAGSTRIFKTTYTGDSFYVSYADSDHPPGQPASEQWLRANYDASSAAGFQFWPVAGKQNTYTLLNTFHEQKESHWLNWAAGGWLHTTGLNGNITGDGDGAMPIEFAPVSGRTGEYYMVSQAVGNENNYVTLDCTIHAPACTHQPPNGATWWLRSASPDIKTALTIKLEDVPPPASSGLKWAYCETPLATPSQINVQLASGDSVVVSWITFEATNATTPPEVQWMESGNGEDSRAGSTLAWTSTKGATHIHTTAARDRRYHFHFVKLSGLKPRAQYTYKVRSGAAAAVWSNTFRFRAPYAAADGGETRVNIYGDMGIYSYNNMKELRADCNANASSSTVDAVVHMGDHAYNEGDNDERRADGYFQAFQEVLTSCPWMPVVGNHEFYAGALLGRDLNATWQGWGQPNANEQQQRWAPPAASTDAAKDAVAPRPAVQPAVVHEDARSAPATSIGSLLSIANFHGPGSNGPVPSQSSRYFSVDLGLIHLIALNLNPYFGCDPLGSAAIESQKKWLEQDLIAANANREAVPWVRALPLNGPHLPAAFCNGPYSPAALLAGRGLFAFPLLLHRLPLQEH